MPCFVTALRRRRRQNVVEEQKKIEVLHMSVQRGVAAIPDEGRILVDIPIHISICKRNKKPVCRCRILKSILIITITTKVIINLGCMIFYVVAHLLTFLTICHKFAILQFF